MHLFYRLPAVTLVVLLAFSGPSSTVAVAGGGSDTRVTVRDGQVFVVTGDEDGHHDAPFGAGAAFLGVRLDSDRDGRGAHVRRVMPDTAAERAGLRDGDRIVAVEGRAIDDIGDLMERIGDYEPGDRIDLEVERDGRRQTLAVELGERKEHRQFFGRGFDAEDFGERFGEQFGERFGERMRELGERLGERFGEGFAFRFDGETFDSEQFQDRMRELAERLGELEFDVQVPEFHGHYRFDFRDSRPKLGVMLVETTRELRRHLGGDGDAGVLVSKILPDMPAEAAGVAVGDLIVAVDGETVADAGDLRRALGDRAGETVELEVIRDGRTLRLDVRLAEAAPARSGYRSSGGGSRSSGSAAALGAYSRALEAGERVRVGDRVRDALEQYRRALAYPARDLADTF